MLITQGGKFQVHGVLTGLLFIACCTTFTWGQSQTFKLLSDDGAADSGFGLSVTVDGKVAIVGASGDDQNGEDAGAAYLFDTSTGEQLRKLVPDDAIADQNFGSSVAIAGNIALVGASKDNDNGIDAGAAYLFDVSTGQQVQKLLSEDVSPGKMFGAAVAIHGSTAIIGAPGDVTINGTDEGSAYLFDITSGQQMAKLMPDDGAPGAAFGLSVAIDDQYALIGAFLDDDNGFWSGSAYLFDINTGQPVHKLFPDVPLASEFFGVSVAINGDIALVGAHGDAFPTGRVGGSVYLFDVTTGNQIGKLTPEDSEFGDAFGISIAVSGNLALIGSWRDDDLGDDAGAVYLFNLDTGEQLGKILPMDGAADDSFGTALAVSGQTLLVGSYEDDDNGMDSGSAYIFDIPEPSTTALFLIASVLIARQRRIS